MRSTVLESNGKDVKEQCTNNQTAVTCKWPGSIPWKCRRVKTDTCLRCGHKTSFSKKTQVFTEEENAIVTSLLAVGGNLAENISEFTYLGQTFSNNELNSFTEFQVSKTIDKFNEMTQIVTGHKVNMTTKMELREVCVLSRL